MSEAYGTASEAVEARAIGVGVEGFSASSGDLHFYRSLLDAGFSNEQALAIASGMAQFLAGQMKGLASQLDIATLHNSIQAGIGKAEGSNSRAQTETAAALTKSLAETKADLTKNLADVDAKLTVSLADIKAGLIASLSATELKLTTVIAELKTSVVANMLADKGEIKTASATSIGSLRESIENSRADLLKTLLSAVGLQTVAILGAAFALVKWMHP